MGCEYLGHEYRKGEDHLLHERIYCVANGEGCLVDVPMGYVNCTRRTWVMLQGVSPAAPVVKTRRKKYKPQRAALL